MLQLTPQMLILLRASQGSYLARMAMQRPEKPAPKIRINQDRRKHLVNRVASIIREAHDAGRTATLLTLEAPLRHSLRSKLCMNGWQWRDADALAADIVAEALRRVGAQRPTWAEGQPEYAQNGAGALIERTRCIRCHTPLPEGHFKFCSTLCTSAHHHQTARLIEAEQEKAYDRAARL